MLFSNSSFTFEFHKCVSFSAASIEDDSDTDTDTGIDSKGKKEIKRVSLDQKRAAVEHFKLPNGKSRKLRSVKNRYRFVQSYTQLNRWKKEIEDGKKCIELSFVLNKCTFQIYVNLFETQLGGNRFDKQKEVDAFVWDRFEHGRHSFGRVHDHDLRQWAIEKSNEVEFFNVLHCLYYLENHSLHYLLYVLLFIRFNRK